MEKVHMARYPNIEEEQRDLKSSLISMLNCRRYLGSLGFGEIVDTSWDHEGINCIANGGGSIILSDGSEVSNKDFINTNDRDALIERVILKGAHLYLGDHGYAGERRRAAIRTTFGDDHYRFFLSIRDTTKEKAGFLWGTFKSKPEKFANSFYMGLKKQIITDQDLVEFAEYKQGLEDSMRQGTLMTYFPEFTQRRSAQTQEVEIPQEETQFIDPWKVKIPKLSKK